MTNKTITLDRELLSRIVGLRADYTCAQLDADEEAVRALLAESVPAAGGEPEVVANVITTGGPHDREDRVLCELQAELPPVGTELVDRAHVTRLQAEVERWRLAHRLAMQDNIKLQSELTKARELLVRCQPRLSHCSLLDDVRGFLSKQP